MSVQLTELGKKFLAITKGHKFATGGFLLREDDELLSQVYKFQKRSTGLVY